MNNISIYEEVDGDIEALKNKGEKEQAYEPKIFWSWWKKKISYDYEEVSFFIVTDREEFPIPHDIIIAEKSTLPQNAINNLLRTLPINLRVISIPEIKNLKINTKKVVKTKKIKKSENIFEQPSLSNYFRSKTRVMKGTNFD